MISITHSKLSNSMIRVFVSPTAPALAIHVHARAILHVRARAILPVHVRATHAITAPACTWPVLTTGKTLNNKPLHHRQIIR